MSYSFYTEYKTSKVSGHVLTIDSNVTLIIGVIAVYGK